MTIILNGRYTDAKVFSDHIEETATIQILELMNQPFTEDCKIRIMPDVHAGAGCVIGFTADLKDKVVPNLVGVDIGCGMLVVPLGNSSRNLSLRSLDETIKNQVPSGRNIHKEPIIKFQNLENLSCLENLNKTENFNRAIGTLGGRESFHRTFPR